MGSQLSIIDQIVVEGFAKPSTSYCKEHDFIPRKWQERLRIRD